MYHISIWECPHIIIWEYYTADTKTNINIIYVWAMIYFIPKIIKKM